MSVTFDVTAGASLQTPPPKLPPPEPTLSDSFAALVDSNLPAPPSDPPVSGTTPLPPSSSGSSGGSLSSTTGTTLARNLQAFLTLLTTQLQNQNPLDRSIPISSPKQLVEFAY